MKTRSTRPVGYRNEIVFRSAQRLARTRHTSPSAGPRPWRLLTLGACALFAAGLLIGLRWSRPERSETALTTAPAPAEELAPAESEPKPAPTLSHPTASPPDLTAKVASKRLERSTSARYSAPDTLDQLESLDTASAPARAGTPTQQPDRPWTEFAHTTLAAATSTLVRSADLTLAGELRYADSTALLIEFELKRRDRGVTGLVRYLSPAGRRVAAHVIKGDLSDRTLELREVERAWISTPPTLESRLAERDFGRVFVFSLPAPASAPTSTELNGIWRLGALSGPLLLRFSSPW